MYIYIYIYIYLVIITDFFLHYSQVATIYPMTVSIDQWRAVIGA